LRTHKTRLGVALVAAAFCAAASPCAAGAIYNMSSLGNWCGYAFGAPSGTTVKSASATWTVPAITNTKITGTGSNAGFAYASFWVGIDDFSTIEQIGTESTVSGGYPDYYAWYEMYPAGSVLINTMYIAPGDSVSASVQYNSSGTFQMSITDTSRANDSFSQSFPAGQAARSSAEWIAEAPSSGTILPLSEFGKATFTSVSASLSNGASGPLGSFSSYPYYGGIQLSPATSSGLGAIPSPLDPTGSSFTVATTWPGDVNSDGRVDVNDLTTVLTNYGKTSGMWWGTGDLTGDGVVDINDLTIVLTHYGQTLGASAPALAGVPEPCCLAMLGAAVGLIALVGLRRSGR
jgi:hypothetical protein